MMIDHTESVEEIRARLRGYDPARDPYALWPKLGPERLQRASGSIRGVAEAVLRGASRPPALDVRERREVEALGVAGYISGLGPLLGWWIENGTVDASPPVRETCEQHLRHGALRIARLRGHLTEVVGALRAAGMDPIVLKGLHTGAEYFPDPATRPSGDLDLLVAPRQRARAERVLDRCGFVEHNPAPGGGRSEWRLASASAEVRSLRFDHEDSPWHLDLHWELSRSYHPAERCDLGETPFANHGSATIDGEQVRVLAQPCLTAFLAVHAGCDLSHVRLVRLVELVLVVRRDLETGRLDWRALSHLLEGTGSARFAYPALALAEELAPGTMDRRCLARAGRDVTSRVRRLLATLARHELAPLPASERTVERGLAWLPGPRARMRSLAARLLGRGLRNRAV